MTIRRVAAPLLALALALSLSACSKATDAEKEECQSRGGEVVKERFPYEKPSGLFDRETGFLEYCELEGGVIGQVYNDVIEAPDSGFLGDTDDNQEIFSACEAINGVTYKTRKKSGKSTHTRFLCVRDGKPQLLI